MNQTFSYILFLSCVCACVWNPIFPKRLKEGIKLDLIVKTNVDKVFLWGQESQYMLSQYMQNATISHCYQRIVISYGGVSGDSLCLYLNTISIPSYTSPICVKRSRFMKQS